MKLALLVVASLLLAASAQEDCKTSFVDRSGGSDSTTGNCIILCDINTDPSDPCEGDENSAVDIFYTVYQPDSAGKRVKKLNVPSDSTQWPWPSGPGVSIDMAAELQGADGILGNPRNKDELYIAEQNSNSVARLSIPTGAVLQRVGVNAGAFHLDLEKVGSDLFLYVSEIPGKVRRVALGAAGEFGAVDNIVVTGDDTVITQIINTPYGKYYTNAGANGVGGSFGKINVDGTGAFVTERVTSGDGYHGGFYDSKADLIVTTGANWVRQFQVVGGVTSHYSSLQRTVLDQYDQGTHNGKGQYFVIDNGGQLCAFDTTFGTGYRIAEAKHECVYGEPRMDDAAPLVGLGGTC